MVGTDLSIAERIAADLERLDEDEAVVLRLMCDGEFRVIHGFLKAKDGIPAMITLSGTLLPIRPVTNIGGQSFEYSSLTRDDARWN